MIIRYAKEEDLPMLVEIYNQSVQTSAATFDLTPVTVEQRRSWFDNHISNELFPLIVAERDGVVAGYASLSSYRDKEAYIQTVELSIYIDKNQQGYGIGKQLMKRILELAKNSTITLSFQELQKGMISVSKCMSNLILHFAENLKK